MLTLRFTSVRTVSGAGTATALISSLRSFSSSTHMLFCSSTTSGETTFSDLEATIQQQKEQRQQQQGQNNSNNANRRRELRSGQQHHHNANRHHHHHQQHSTSNNKRDDRGGGGRGYGGGGDRYQQGNNNTNNSSSNRKRDSNRDRDAYRREQQQQQQQRERELVLARRQRSGVEELATPSQQPQKQQQIDVQAEPKQSMKRESVADVVPQQQQQQQQQQQHATTTSSSSSSQPVPQQQQPDVRQLELRLRQAHEKLDRVLERIKNSNGLPISSIADSNLASVPPPHFGSNREIFLSSQENPFIEQFFEPDDEATKSNHSSNDSTSSSYDDQQLRQENSPRITNKSIALGKGKDVAFSRTEFGVARAELVGVVCEPIKVMQDTLLNRNFARIALKVVHSNNSSNNNNMNDANNNNNNTLQFEVRCYGEALLRACLDGGIQDPSTTHTILHVSGKMMKTDRGEMIIAATEEHGSLSVVVADPK